MTLATADVHAEKWQYATLLHTGPFTWRTGDQTFSATTNRQFPEFYKEVTAQPWPCPAPEFSPETLAKLLDGIGAAGWELVQVELANNNARTYYFKRRAPA